MSELKTAFSQELKRAFAQQKVSVVAAAKALGVSRQSVHSYLNGSSLPRQEVFANAVRIWNLNFSIGNSSFDKDAFPQPKLSSVPLQMTMVDLFDSIKAEDLKLNVERNGNAFRISVSIQVA